MMDAVDVNTVSENNDLCELPRLDQSADASCRCKGCSQSYTTPISMNTFQRPYNPQISSSLLQLPAELRSKILRLLLLHRGTISPWSWYIHVLDPERGANCYEPQRGDWLLLSAHILRCCQLIYRDGVAILYQENTICIEVSRMDFDWIEQPYYLTVLDKCGSFPTEPCQGNLESVSCECALEWEHKFARFEGDLGSPLTKQTCQLLLRFNKFVIRINTGYYHIIGNADDMHLYSLTYLLRDYVSAKKVTVWLHAFDIGTSERSLQFKCFELWRCESLNFRDWYGFLTDPQVRMTQQVATSAAPVKDPNSFIGLYQRLFPRLRSILDDCCTAEQESWPQWKSALAAVIEQNKQKFKDGLRELITLVENVVDYEIEIFAPDPEEEHELDDEGTISVRDKKLDNFCRTQFGTLNQHKEELHRHLAIVAKAWQ